MNRSMKRQGESVGIIVLAVCAVEHAITLQQIREGMWFKVQILASLVQRTTLVFAPDTSSIMIPLVGRGRVIRLDDILFPPPLLLSEILIIC